MKVVLTANPWMTLDLGDKDHPIRDDATNVAWVSRSSIVKRLRKVGTWEYQLRKSANGQRIMFMLVGVGKDNLDRALGCAVILELTVSGVRVIQVPWVWRYSWNELSATSTFNTEFEAAARGFTKELYFSYGVKTVGGVLSDAQQTKKGRALWGKLVKAALASKMRVYLTANIASVPVVWSEVKNALQIRDGVWQPAHLVPEDTEHESQLLPHIGSWGNVRLLITAKALKTGRT